MRKVGTSTGHEQIYFAAFELAAIAGTWVLLNAGDFRVGHWCAVLAPLLTLGWIFSNVRSHDYHTYWWAALKKIEAFNGWTTTRPEYASKYEDRRNKIPLFGKLPYSIFTDWFVPIFFFIVWGFILQIDWHGTTHNEPVLAQQAHINDNPTDWWLVAFTGALAVVAALQFGALMWQILTTRKTAGKELRAYIFPLQRFENQRKWRFETESRLYKFWKDSGSSMCQLGF